MESVSDLFFGLVAQNYALLILLMTFGFLYASFGRLKIFHHNRPAQAVIALVLAFGTAGIIHAAHQEEMAKIIAGLVAAGIVSMVVWAVALQRGRTRQEEERRHEERKRDKR